MQLCGSDIAKVGLACPYRPRVPMPGGAKGVPRQKYPLRVPLLPSSSFQAQGMVSQDSHLSTSMTMRPSLNSQPNSVSNMLCSSSSSTLPLSPSPN